MPRYTSTKEKTGHTDDQIFEVKNNSGIEWIILGEENGQLKLTTKNLVQPTSGGYEYDGFQYYRLLGKAGYTNFINELSEIGAIYGKGKYADTSKFEVITGGATGGRSFKMEDLGYTVSRSGTAYTYAIEKHTGDTEPKVYRYDGATIPDGTSTTIETNFRITNLEYMEQDASKSTEEGMNLWKSLENENQFVTIYPYTYSGSQTLSKEICKADKQYWLSSRFVNFNNSTVDYSGSLVSGISGKYSESKLCESFSFSHTASAGIIWNCGVRPVVYLEPGVQLSEYNSADNSYTIIGSLQEENPGVLEDLGNNKLQITSIEDLLALSYNVNSGAETYEGKTIELGINLDFKNDSSYKDSNAKYVLEESKGYVRNESGRPIKELLLDETGKGFIPIGINGGFKGNFNGKGRVIRNIFINADSFGRTVW